MSNQLVSYSSMSRRVRRPHPSGGGNIPTVTEAMEMDIEQP